MRALRYGKDYLWYANGKDKSFLNGVRTSLQRRFLYLEDFKDSPNICGGASGRVKEANSSGSW